MPLVSPLKVPAADVRTSPSFLMVSPKHTNHEFALTSVFEHRHEPASVPLGFLSVIVTEARATLDELLRTITAPCTEVPLADLTAQACAPTSGKTVTVLSHFHSLGLEVIGFLLP
jgi:hypothetical protein